MMRYHLDTDHFTLVEVGRPAVGSRLSAIPPDEVAVSAVTVEESLRGRLAILSRARDGETRIKAYGHLPQIVQNFGPINVIGWLMMDCGVVPDKEVVS